MGERGAIGAKSENCIMISAESENRLQRFRGSIPIPKRLQNTRPTFNGIYCESTSTVVPKCLTVNLGKH